LNGVLDGVAERVIGEAQTLWSDGRDLAAAVDRVVHHSWIIEFGREIKSFRAEEAARRSGIQLDGGVGGGGSTSLTTGAPDADQDTPE